MIRLLLLLFWCEKEFQVDFFFPWIPSRAGCLTLFTPAHWIVSVSEKIFSDRFSAARRIRVHRFVPTRNEVIFLIDWISNGREERWFGWWCSVKRRRFCVWLRHKSVTHADTHTEAYLGIRIGRIVWLWCQLLPFWREQQAKAIGLTRNRCSVSPASWLENMNLFNSTTWNRCIHTTFTW